MAGSFGYEAEHFEISQKIGEQRLFPAIRKMDSEIQVAANGTSCRHQISDGTGRVAKHPAAAVASLPKLRSSSSASRRCLGAESYCYERTHLLLHSVTRRHPSPPEEVLSTSLTPALLSA